MDDRLGPALIINDGRLGGLLASWGEGTLRGQGASSDSRPWAYIPADDRPARDTRRAKVLAQVELCGLHGVIERQLLRFDVPPLGPANATSSGTIANVSGGGGVAGSTPAAGLSEQLSTGGKTSAMLISAVLEAAGRGITRVIWPVHAGLGGADGSTDVEQLSGVLDRALLVSQLVGIDSTRGGRAPLVRVYTPYADLSDQQLMDLALDMDAPLETCWWCLNEGERQCGHCAGCMRWREALAAVDPAGQLSLDVSPDQA